MKNLLIGTLCLVVITGIAQADAIYDTGFINLLDDNNWKNEQAGTSSGSANNGTGESGPGMYSLFGSAGFIGGGSGSGGSAGWQGLHVIYASNDDGDVQGLGENYRIGNGLWAFGQASDPEPAVPEPGTLLLLGAGLIGLLGYRVAKVIGSLGLIDGCVSAGKQKKRSHT